MSEYYTPPRLANLDLPLGKRVRLQRLLYKYGPGNGKLLVLPIDQGIEHGPVDFFSNPDAKHPRYQYELAKQGGYSAIALHYGLASKYLRDYAGEVPLILKLNGRTNVPGETEPFSPLTSGVEDAVRLGADAVGYTLYVGSPRQAEEIAQFSEVRSACDHYGMPLVMWGYPRGSAIEAKGGRDSFYAIDYAARLGEELGADIVKINLPKFSAKDGDSPKPYDTLGSDLGLEGAFRQCVESAGKCMVLVSGGSRVGDDDLLEKVRLSMRAGATGLIFGRNFWQRPMKEALAITEKVREIIAAS
ncbi:MAG: fructose-bisphosphate aldolase [bacterium]|nr:fructose-bisphosphate aldolase [bacterium]